MKNLIFSVLLIFMILLLSTCSLYNKRIYNNPYDSSNTEGATPLEVRTMTIDGDAKDWDDIPILIDDGFTSTTEGGYPFVSSGDIGIIKATQDDENLYFYFEINDGIPLETPGLGYRVSVATEEWENYTDLWSIDHGLIGGTSTSNGTFGFNSPSNLMAIRYSGYDPFSNFIELGMSKYQYWDLIEVNTKLRFLAHSSFTPYLESYGNGDIDSLNDDQEIFVVLKGPDDVTPSEYTPIVQFDRASPVIDGSNADFSTWSNTGWWIQDFTTDDGNDPQDNTDIERVYIKQDDDYVYFLLTFTDSGLFIADSYYTIEMSKSDSSEYHSYSANFVASWITQVTDLSSSTNPNGCQVADGVGYGLEMGFPKFSTLDYISPGAFQFRISVQNSSLTEVDAVEFNGSYKGEFDVAPTVF